MADVENIYADEEDTVEEVDTQYVVQQMFRSEESLMVYFMIIFLLNF